MNRKLHFIAAALAFTALGAQAQTAGSLLGRVGITQINPDVRSGNLTAPSLPGSQADVGSSTRLGGGLTYMVTDNVAIDLPLALPFKHEITGAGAIAGVGKIGELRALPVTLIAEWRFFDANAKWRPSLGGGVTYAKVYRERSTAALSALTGGSPTTLTVESKWALTGAAGITYNINDRMFVEGTVHKTLLKTTAHLSTGQTLAMKLDPWSYSIGIGMKLR